MKTLKRGRFFINLPSLTRVSTTRQISSSSLLGSNTVAHKHLVSDSVSPCIIDSEDEERDLVQNLDYDNKEIQIDFMQALSDAQATLQKRVAKQDLVEEHILNRRYRNRLPTLAKKLPNIDSQKQTTKQRLVKKQVDEEYKDKCRYFKLYEEELEKHYEKLTIELKECHKNREEIRKECSDIKKRSVEVADEVEKLKSLLATQETKENRKLKRNQEDYAKYVSYKSTLKEKIEEKKLEAGTVGI